MFLIDEQEQQGKVYAHMLERTKKETLLLSGQSQNNFIPQGF